MRLNIAFSVAVSAAAIAACVSFLLQPEHHAFAATAVGPNYADSGDMLPPGNYREWVYLSTGLDMSYTANAKAPDHSMFDNVFVNPVAYASFKATGTWPDKTVMVLEVREARDRVSINQRGHFQGTGVMGIEVHVKDESRFPGKWAFFDFDAPDKPGKLFPRTAACYTCHEAHGAVDTTFVQFYPTLMPVAQEKKTLSAAYLKEENPGK